MGNASFYSLFTSMSHRLFFNIWKAGWELPCTLCPIQKPAFPFIVQSQAEGMTRPVSVPLLQLIKTKSPAPAHRAVHQICVNLRTGYTGILFACKALLSPGVSKCIHCFAHFACCILGQYINFNRPWRGNMQKKVSVWFLKSWHHVIMGHCAFWWAQTGMCLLDAKRSLKN